MKNLNNLNNLNTKNFVYFNCNIKNVRTDDCVIRAIAAGTGESWERTARGLFDQMMETGYMMSTPECYGEYLKKKGWVQQKQIVRGDKRKVKLCELATKFDGHCVIHAGSGHVSYIERNKVWDIWSCEDRVAGVCWIPKNEVAQFNKVREEFMSL